MTLTMADGPVANMPAGMDAYAGYTNDSGIGETFPDVLKIPAKYHLSITTDGSPAYVGDVERGAMSNWAGYVVGYCAVSNVESLIAQFGRPTKLWTAHYDASIGSHICSPSTCAYPGLAHAADGTQWTDNGNADWDASVLADDFFSFLTPTPAPPSKEALVGSSSFFVRTTADAVPSPGVAAALKKGSAIVIEINPQNGLYVKNVPPATALGAAANQNPANTALQGTLDARLNESGSGVEGVYQNASNGAMTYFNIPGDLKADGTVVVGLNNIP